jgi:hypothetical protein
MADRASNLPGTEYIRGLSERGIRRLMLQAAIPRPITERLLRGAGIRHGMRVLGLGCGAGDLALLAAELVGVSGSVVGLDRHRDVWGSPQDRRGRSAEPDRRSGAILCLDPDRILGSGAH